MLFRSQRDREIAEELQAHIEFEARKYIASGMQEKEAWRRANIAFGAKAQAVEECREQRGIGVLENFARDSRYAFRVFRRSRAFTLSVVLTIAIAVGANTTVFSFCKAMLLATLPVPNPQQLYFVSIDYPGSGFPPYAYFMFPDLQDMQKAVQGTAAITGFTEAVNFHVRDDSGTTSTIRGRLVTGNFFSALQVKPLAGRVFTERDNVPGSEAVAALSYRFWTKRFGSDTSVIGRRLLIQRKPVTVVAVMPPGFDGVEPGVQPDIWMPLSVQAAIGFGGYANADSIDWKRPWMQQNVWWLHVLAWSPHGRSNMHTCALD
jgi:hypothetical protein